MNPFHPLQGEFELPSKFTNPFDYQPCEIVRIASQEVMDYLSARQEWREELSKGKMFGVLIVRNTKGEIGFLTAFSGNLAGESCHTYFTPPIFDLQDRANFFKEEESEITNINITIKRLRNSEEYCELQSKLRNLQLSAQRQIADLKGEIKARKAKRDEIRTNSPSAEIIKELTKESQYQKAELKRVESVLKSQIIETEAQFNKLNSEIENLKVRRQSRSLELQKKIFDSYKILNFDLKSSTLTEIFERVRHTLPPAGTGECAAPKLLNYALSNNLRPIAMGEFWWGQSPVGEVRRHAEFYTACKSKCEPILNYVLEGVELDSPASDYKIMGELEVIYQDEQLAVVNKPAGMLSVSGRVSLPSVEGLLPSVFSQHPDVKVVHRLDMDTSGILLIALNRECYVDLQRQFAQRTLQKRYVAILDGVLGYDSAEIDLPLSPNFEERPRQRVDHISGKEALTHLEVISRTESTTRVALIPHTGRTHQLRLHCAHAEGAAMPIVGDRLYGSPAERLMLHAEWISFTHPRTLERLTFEVAAPF